MTREDITNRVRKIVSEVMEIPVEEIAQTTEMVADLGADDLDRLEILFRAEEICDLEIHDDDAESIRTVGGLVDFLTGKLGAMEAA